MIKEITIKHMSGVAYSYTEIKNDGTINSFAFNSSGDPISELYSILYDKSDEK